MRFSSSKFLPQLPADGIATLYAGQLGRFQLIRCSGQRDTLGPMAATFKRHMLIPLAGAFLWHRPVGEPVFANSKSVLHVAANDGYRISHPAGEELSAVFWPSRFVTTELGNLFGSQNLEHDHVESPCANAIQLALHRLVALHQAWGDEIAIEEALINILRLNCSMTDQGKPVPIRSLRVIRQTKDYLHAHMGDKLKLLTVAEVVGVSPVYLTQLFAASEGVPLYRYHLDLRLNAALVQLPHCDNITQLALELGFSSHSHFSFEFGRRFGIPPSAYRDSIRPANEKPSHRAWRGTEDGHRPFLQVGPLCEARGGLGHSLPS